MCIDIVNILFIPGLPAGRERRADAFARDAHQLGLALRINADHSCVFRDLCTQRTREGRYGGFTEEGAATLKCVLLRCN